MTVPEVLAREQQEAVQAALWYGAVNTEYDGNGQLVALDDAKAAQLAVQGAIFSGIGPSMRLTDAHPQSRNAKNALGFLSRLMQGIAVFRGYVGTRAARSAVVHEHNGFFSSSQPPSGGSESESTLEWGMLFRRELHTVSRFTNGVLRTYVFDASTPWVLVSPLRIDEAGIVGVLLPAYGLLDASQLVFGYEAVRYANGGSSGPIETVRLPYGVPYYFRLSGAPASPVTARGAAVAADELQTMDAYLAWLQSVAWDTGLRVVHRALYYAEERERQLHESLVRQTASASSIEEL